jgi:hypothetical protein
VLKLRFRLSILPLDLIVISRAEQLMLAQHADKENYPVDINQGESGTRGGNASPGGFFRKRSSARSKSLGKDNWDSAFFGEFKRAENKATPPRVPCAALCANRCR